MARGFRVKREQLQRFRRHLPGSEGQNLVLTVSYVPSSLESGGLVFKAHRLLYHSTLGSKVKEKKRRRKGYLGKGVPVLETEENVLADPHHLPTSYYVMTQMVFYCIFIYAISCCPLPLASRPSPSEPPEYSC